MLEAFFDNFELLLQSLFFLLENLDILVGLLVLSELLLQLEDLLRLLAGSMVHVIDSLRLDFELLVLGLQFRDGDGNAQLLEQEL